MDLLSKGLLVSAYGIGGVFIVLILFYFITKAMVALANKYVKESAEQEE